MLPAEGKEQVEKGLLAASCHYLARAVGRVVWAEEAMELEQVEAGREGGRRLGVPWAWGTPLPPHGGARPAPGGS